MGKPVRMKGVEWEGKTFSVSVKDVQRPMIQQALDIFMHLTTSGMCGRSVGANSSKTLLLIYAYDGLSCGFCDHSVKGLTDYQSCLRFCFFGLEEHNRQFNGGQRQYSHAAS
jgi:hypothetical protein